jgi:FkbM family methyltransferase
VTEAATPLVPLADEQQWVQSLPRRLARRVGWAIRDVWPSRAVTREVQGVSMSLPWVHRLPDYTAAPGSVYGQNLVRLAALLHTAEEPLHVLDVGANVGDSALQVLAGTPGARVLCVEADDFYLPFLRRNTAAVPVVVEAALLLTEAAAPGAAALRPVRRWGTTTFAAADAPGRTATVTVAELVARHADFATIRLVKSDTDGYDVLLVPALARAYAANRPVLFFEYDLRQTRAAGLDPVPVWDELTELGYAEVAIWSNGGQPLARLPIATMRAAVEELDAREAVEAAAGQRQTAYWDVAVVHADDEPGLAAVRELVPSHPV